ncbi:MAG: undecaprenyl-diphosphate phosphatase [Gaiellaceae bacterium]
MLLASVISYPRAIVLGLLQGVSELFPISSLGHTVILPRLVGWNIHQNDSYFIAFLVALHLATALVLLAFFWRDWVRILRGIGRSLRDRGIDPEDSDAKLGWLLVVGTIPAGILGLALESKLRSVFASTTSASVFLMLNGVVLYGAELLRRRAPQQEVAPEGAEASVEEPALVAAPAQAIAAAAGTGTASVTAEPATRHHGPPLLSGSGAEESVQGDRRIVHRVDWLNAFIIGAAQALALIPGFSRSGAAMGGGLLVGLSHKDSARFAFLLATPIIGAAALLKLPDLMGSNGNGVRGPALAGAAAAAFTAYLAVRFLMRFFETNRLTPFAIYSFLAGAAALTYFLAS